MLLLYAVGSLIIIAASNSCKSRLGHLSWISCVSWNWIVHFAWAALFHYVSIITQRKGLRDAQLLLQNALRPMEESCHVLGNSCTKVVILAV